MCIIKEIYNYNDCNVIYKNLGVRCHANMNNRYGCINTILIIEFLCVPHSRKIKNFFIIIDIIIDEISLIIMKIYTIAS